MGLIRQQFSTNGGLDVESVLIRLYEHSWSPYTHVDIVRPDGSLLGARSDSVGGKPPGVQIRPANYETWAHVALVELPCSDAVEAAYLAFAEAQIGKPYDTTAIMHMALLNANPTVPAPERNWADDDSWFCSELDLAAKQASGFFPFPLVVRAQLLTPADDLLLCSAFVNVFTGMRSAVIA